MNDFRELLVWKKSINFVEKLYIVTNNFPNEEKFGLVNQLRRAGISISSNIAEGSGRNGNKEFVNFLSIAIGSSFEIETQLLISKRYSI